MIGRIFLGLFSRINCLYSAPRLNVGGRIGYHSYSTSARVEVAAQENFKAMQDLGFEQFKKTRVKSFEEYKKSPFVKEVFGSDAEKLAQGYEDYCLCKFNRYRLTKYGGNPATMI